MTKEEGWLLEEKYSGKKTGGFFADCLRLKNGEPLAYVIGRIPFLDTTILLDSQPLIPRTETEYWVQHAISEILESQIAHPHILDLCAGSGCIGIAILHHLPETTVDFVEINTKHHTTIERNMIQNNVEPLRSRIFGGNLFSDLGDTLYDFILSNPPYLDEASGKADESVITHEPREALFAKQNGMQLIRQIIKEAPLYLKDSGVLYIEHEPEQVSEILQCALLSGFTAESFPDQYNLSRFTRLSRIGDKKVRE